MEGIRILDPKLHRGAEGQEGANFKLDLNGLPKQSIVLEKCPVDFNT